VARAARLGSAADARATASGTPVLAAELNTELSDC